MTVVMMLLQIALVTLLLNYITYVDNSKSNYVIPTPEFVISESGFQVSIPDTEGIEIFYFNGRINRKNGTSLETDTIELNTRKKIDYKWLIKVDNVNLKVGDTINYWIFIKKNGVGYRKPAGYYTVEDITETYKPTTSNVWEYTTQTHFPTIEPNAYTYNDPVNLDSVPYKEREECNVDCSKQLNNMTEVISLMQNQIKALEEVVKQLAQLMNNQFQQPTTYLEGLVEQET